MSERATIEDLRRRLAAAEAVLHGKADAEAALRESKAALTSDLADTVLLHDLAVRLVSEDDFQTIYEQILSAAMSIMQSAAGTVQVYEPESKTLVLLVTKNFDRRMTDHFHRVGADSKTACGQALKNVVRTFIDFEDEVDEACVMHVEAGYRSAQSTPLLSRSGKPLGMLNTHWREAGHRSTDRQLRFLDLLARQAADLIEQRRAESAVRASEERFRALASAGAVSIYRMSSDWRLMYQIDSTDFLETVAEPIEDWRERYIPLDDRVMVDEAIELAIRTRSMFDLEHRVRLADGGIGWVRSRAVPIVGSDGAVVEWFGAGNDVTDRKRAEAGLRDSEERFRQFAASSSDALWIRDAETLVMEYVSPAIRDIYGVPPETLLGDPERWTDRIVSDDRARAIGHIERARSGEAVEHEFRIVRPSDGQQRWIKDAAFPLLDAQGRVQRIGGIAEDVTEAKYAANRLEGLVKELQHRTRNLMNMVRALAGRTLRGSTDLEDFKTRYGDRLAALSRVQDLLARLDEGQRIALDELVRAEVALLEGETDRIALDGPGGITLRPVTVQALSLGLHELVTNAVKHGAFSQRQGRLEIRWRRARFDDDERSWLEVDWRERDVVVPAPEKQKQALRAGAGQELIEKALPYQFGARTRFAIEQGRIHCTIALPASEGRMAQENADA